MVEDAFNTLDRMTFMAATGQRSPRGYRVA
jgi:hypothetical protein